MFQNVLNRHWLTYILPMVFFAFMFHFYVSIHWYSTLSVTEIYDFYVSFLVSMFHTKNTEGEKQKHCGSDSKPLWERFKNTEGAWKRSLSVFKNETLKSYVSFFEMIDIQLLYNKKWNMKDKSKVLKTYGYMWDKLEFVCLIGGRVFNPRQQQNVLNIYNMLLPRVTNPPPN